MELEIGQPRRWGEPFGVIEYKMTLDDRKNNPRCHPQPVKEEKRSDNGWSIC